MKHLFTLIIFILFAWLGMWWYYSCDWCIDKDALTEKTDPETEALAKKAYEDSIAMVKRFASGLYAINEKNEDVFRFPDNFSINNTNGNVYIPDQLAGFADAIADYFGKHQNEELIISGYETSAEKQSGVSLGASRADFVKNILIDSGINGDRIVTQAQIKSYSYNTEGKYYGGIDLNFKTLDANRLAEIEKGIANKTLYSGFAQKTFKPDATLTNYTVELKNYLEKYPNKKVQIIGHTDDIGEAEANLWFGQERANNVRDYLVSQGINANLLIASSKGESEPIVPNDSDENRDINRRIEIFVN